MGSTKTNCFPLISRVVVPPSSFKLYSHVKCQSHVQTYTHTHIHTYLARFFAWSCWIDDTNGMHACSFIWTFLKAAILRTLNCMQPCFQVFIAHSSFVGMFKDMRYWRLVQQSLTQLVSTTFVFWTRKAIIGEPRPLSTHD